MVALSVLKKREMEVWRDQEGATQPGEGKRPNGLTTPGKIRVKAAAAHAAFGLPPSSESANSNSGWRTGFENETVDESTNVILRTPQP